MLFDFIECYYWCLWGLTYLCHRPSFLLRTSYSKHFPHHPSTWSGTMMILLEKTPAVLLGVACVAAAGIPLIITLNLIYRLTSDASLPDTLPWAGVDANGGRLARLKANLRSLFHTEALLQEGYNKASAYVFQGDLVDTTSIQKTMTGDIQADCSLVLQTWPSICTSPYSYRTRGRPPIVSGSVACSAAGFPPEPDRS